MGSFGRPLSRRVVSNRGLVCHLQMLGLQRRLLEVWQPSAIPTSLVQGVDCWQRWWRCTKGGRGLRQQWTEVLREWVQWTAVWALAKVEVTCSMEGDRVKAAYICWKLPG